MQLTIDLSGHEVLVTGSATAARQAVRRYEAAGAVVYRLSTPDGAPGDGHLPERPFLVAAVDDGQAGWEPLLERCREAGIPVSIEPAPGPERHVTLVGGGPGA
ncbi:MAG: uroporphyrinogen-III C-methyltransferase, partial [Gemmatimonadales bacterium]